MRTAVAAAAAILALAAGCGGTDSVGVTPPTGDTQNGKELFTAKCSSCHTLADAGARGVIGPNLDDAFAFSRAKGAEWEDSTIREVVRDQMSYAAPPMPPFDELFPECEGGTDKPKNCSEDPNKDADDVAVYVALVAGKPAAGGGGKEAADGETIFVQNCGGCHTLTAAGTSGNIGPKLDGTSFDLARIVAQVTNGKGAMPAFKGQLTDEQIQAVARYVNENK